MSGAESKPAETNERAEQLRQYFLDMASDQPLQPPTREYIKGGGSLRLSLMELDQLEDRSPEEQALADVRSTYVSALLKHHIMKRRQTRFACQDLRETYIDAVTSKVERIVDAKTPEDALALRQMPTLVDNTKFESDNLSLEDFSANHLYVLSDTALQEHIARREIIAEHHASTPFARIVGNRVVRLSVAGGVFVATLIPELHVFPEGHHELEEHINTAIQLTSAGMFGWEAPEEVRWRYLDFVHGRQGEKLREQLAGDKRMSDLALRMAYSSTRYGTTVQGGTVTGRFGTDDKAENLRRFDKLDDEFVHLNNDPGGKPYTGDEALGYAGRLLVEKRSELDKILTSDTPEQRKASYLQLTHTILTEDVLRMEKGLSSSRLRRALLRTVGILPVMFFPGAVSATSEALSHNQDLAKVVAPDRDS